MNSMQNYEAMARAEMELWQHQMLGKPSLTNRIAKKVQDKINNIIPEKVHEAVTTAIKQMSRLVLFGAGFTTAKPLQEKTLEHREMLIDEKVKWYRNTAAAEGGITGAGGILLGLADFPLLMGIKIKLLFDIAAVYGCDIDDYKERVFILHIFQLSFSSAKKRREVYLILQDWENHKKQLPEDINQFDWRTFQQEYRDYIDLAKMAQLVPIIGAPVGVIVNYGLIKKLGITAKNAYRMRWFTPQPAEKLLIAGQEKILPNIDNEDV